MDISPFLVALARRPFAFGATDCALILADYWLWLGHNYDPAETLRGAYDDEVSCRRVLEANGGLLRIVARMARDVGAPLVTGPDYPVGSVGVVRFGRKGQRQSHYGAIRAPGGYWAIKCSNGLTTARDLRVAAAWEV